MEFHVRNLNILLLVLLLAPMEIFAQGKISVGVVENTTEANLQVTLTDRYLGFGDTVYVADSYPGFGKTFYITDNPNSADIQLMKPPSTDNPKSADLRLFIHKNYPGFGDTIYVADSYPGFGKTIYLADSYPGFGKSIYIEDSLLRFNKKLISVILFKLNLL